MKHKVAISLIVIALLLATVGVAAAAPTAAPATPPRTDIVLGDVKSINGAAFVVATIARGDVSIQTTDRTRFRAKDNANFSLADLKVGDRVTVILEADEAPHTIKAPTDLVRALKASPPAQTRWKELSFTHQTEYVNAIEDAKRPQTRARRIEKTIERLAGEHQTRSNLT